MRYFCLNQRHAINSHARTAVTMDFQAMAGSAKINAMTEHTKITIPKIRHLVFLTPIKPKIPARSVKIPTAAEAIAPMSRSRMAWNAEMGENRPQRM